MATDVKRLDWRTLIQPTAETPIETVTALDKYFEGFAQPPGNVDEYDGKFYAAKGHPCLKCEEWLSGFYAFIGKGGFTWGLAHGEGHCANCHWPARAYHFIKHEDGSQLATLRGVVLQYHPDFVTERRKSA